MCNDLGIEFFLGEGTLLGAVRHAGFIPWDDDIDLIMRRSEYERFLRLAPEQLGPRYQVQHHTTVANYWSPIAKVRLVDGPQRFGQGHIAHLTTANGPLVDIFPMDYVPADRGVGLLLQGTYIRLLRSCLTHKLLRPGRPNRSISRVLLRGVSHLFSTGLLHRQLEWAFTIHGGRPQPFVATLSSYHPVHRQVVPAAVYAEAVTVTFEHHEFPAPVGYHELLERIYGDYLTPPAPAQRGLGHQFTSSGQSPHP